MIKTMNMETKSKMKPKQKANIRNGFLAGLAGVVAVGCPIAQNAGCGRHERERIPEVQAVRDGIPYTTEQERAARDLEMEEDNYTARLKREHEITVLPGDTLEGIAKEVYGYRDMWPYVLDSNTASYVAEGYPRIFAQTPELKEDFAFKKGFNPNKDLKAGMRIRVYFDKPESALKYSKEHPDRYLM